MVIVMATPPLRAVFLFTLSLRGNAGERKRNARERQAGEAGGDWSNGGRGTARRAPTAKEVQRESERLRSLAGLRGLGHRFGIPAVFPLRPQVFHMRHDFLGEELSVLQSQLVRNVAEVLQDHQLTDMHALQRLTELLTHGSRGASNDEA